MTDATDAAKGPNATKADKNPRGGLSAKGREKFGVKKGVVSYGSASTADKKRWVSWAMRFTGTPKPVKDGSGNPTRYALMFRAWGEKVPTSTADVKAVHAKAVKRSAELKKSDSASAAPEMIACADCETERSFLDEATFWTHVEKVHLGVEPTETVPAERAHKCTAPGCDAAFYFAERLAEHAEATHTFRDIEELLREAVREKFYEPGDYRASPPVPGVWAWPRDYATDWVVYEVERDGDSTLYKASYTLVDGVITLGEGVHVVRKTVYEPVKQTQES